MIPNSVGALLLGWCLFVVGATAIFLGMGGGSNLMMGLGISGISLAAVSLLLGSRLSRRGPDPLDARRQQRLWRSGPLGRWWLERRKRLP
jgi:hypothetical protein